MSYTALFLMRVKFMKDSSISYSCKISRSNRVKNSIFVICLNCVPSYLIVEKLQMIFSDLLLEKYLFSMMHAKVI